MRKFVPLGRCRGPQRGTNTPTCASKVEPSVVTAVSAILLQVASKCSAPTKYSASYLSDQLCFFFFSSGSGSSSRLMLDLRLFQGSIGLFYADIENASVTGSSFIMFQLIARCPCVLSFFN